MAQLQGGWKRSSPAVCRPRAWLWGSGRSAELCQQSRLRLISIGFEVSSEARQPLQPLEPLKDVDLRWVQSLRESQQVARKTH